MIDNEMMTKHKNWIAIAEKKHKDRLSDPIKPFEKYLDNQLPDSTTDEHQSHFNHYFLNVRKQTPELLGDVSVRIKPTRDVVDVEGQPFNNKRGCMIVENKCRDLYSAMAFKYDMKACVADLLVANFTSMVVGNNTEIEYSDAVDPAMQALMGEKAMTGEMIEGEQVIPQQEISQIKKNEVVIKRVSYQDAMIDPDSTEYFYNDKNFAVRKVKLTKEQAQGIMPGEKLDTQWETDSKDNIKNDAAKKWVMYEIYDYTGDMVIRSRYMGKCAKKIDDREFNYDPLLFCKFNYLPDQAYVKSDLFYYKSAVQESDFYRTVAMNNLDKGATPKIFAEKNTIDDNNKDKVANDIAFEVVEIDTKGRGLDNVYRLETFNAGDNNYLQAIDRATADIRELAQVNNERFAAKNMPATNATISNNAFMSGVEERKAILKDFIINITKSVVEVLKEISIQQESFTYEQPNGVKEEVTWNNEDIQFVDFTVEVDINTSENDGLKLAAVRDFANWVTQPNIYMGLQAEGKKINFTDTVKMVGGYLMPGKDLDSLIVDANMKSPEEEILEMIKGVQVAPQEGEDYNKHLEAHKAFLTTHPIAQMLPQEILQFIDAHIVATMNLSQQQQSLMQKSSEPMGEGRPMKDPMLGNVMGGVA